MKLHPVTRSFSIVLLLLAYIAGMGHCALATMICQTTDADHHAHEIHTAAVAQDNTPHEPCEHHNDGHVPHGHDCTLDDSLASPPDLSNAGKLLTSAIPFPLFVILLCPEVTAPPAPELPQNSSDSISLIAHGWQFLARAAGFSRAP
jgi:hypothetical protein